MLVRCPGCRAAYRLDPGRLPPTGLRVRCPGCANVFRVRAAGSGAPPSTKPPASAPTSGAAPSGTSLPGLQRDLREPPRAKRRPSLPTQRQAPEVAPKPTSGMPRRDWHSERTLDLNATPAASKKPRLETPPFQLGKPVPPSPLPPQTPPPRLQPALAKAAPSGGTPPPPAPSLQPSPAVDTATRSGETADPLAADAQRQLHERARRLARALVSDILVYNQERRDQALAEGNLASALGAEVNKAWELYKGKVDPQVLRTTSYFKDALNEILAAGQEMF